MYNVQLPINITDVNDNAPVFAQPMYSVQLVENWPVGATVIKTSATDADSGDNGRITYSLQLNEDKCKGGFIFSNRAVPTCHAIEVISQVNK